MFTAYRLRIEDLYFHFPFASGSAGHLARELISLANFTLLVVPTVLPNIHCLLWDSQYRNQLTYGQVGVDLIGTSS